jgi:RNA polymerase-associated protein CTR9
VAFVQLQLASMVHGMPESQRTLADVESAAAGLEEAIAALEVIAKHPTPPYPRNLIEGRRDMAQNTMRNQLSRSLTAQETYEERNAEKIKAAQEQRQLDLKRRADAQAAKVQGELERKAALAAERAKIAEKDRELAEQRDAEARAREEAELTLDSETGERVRRKKKSRSSGRRKRRESEEEADEAAKSKRSRRKDRLAEDEDKPKKKRRLGKREGVPGDKYKSSERVESDDAPDSGESEAATPEEAADSDEPGRAQPKRQRTKRAIESEDEGGADAVAGSPASDAVMSDVE